MLKWLWTCGGTPIKPDVFDAELQLYNFRPSITSHKVEHYLRWTTNDNKRLQMLKSYTHASFDLWDTDASGML